VYVSHTVVSNFHNPRDHSLPGSSVHEISQGSILERVAIPFSRGSSWPRDQTRSPALQQILYHMSQKYCLCVNVYLYLYININLWETASFTRTHLIIDSQVYLVEKAMAPHSSTLAWKIPWTEKPGGLQSMGSLRVGHNWTTSLSLFTFMHWRRKWQPTPVFLPGESQERGSLVGCCLWGCTESDTTEAT